MDWFNRRIGLLAIGLVLVACGETGQREPANAALDKQLTTSDGRTIDLAKLHGRPVLLSFWSTGCRSCLEEIPQLIELHRELGEDGLQLIGISMPHDRPDLVVELERRLAIPYPLVFDPIGELNRQFKTGRITPTHLLISPAGKVVLRQQGRLDFDRLRHSLRTMLQG